MVPGNRPLSPHAQIYKFQLTMLVSVFQRITGAFLGAGLLGFAYWLAAAAYGPEAYATALAILGSGFSLLIMFGITVALSFHMCNGIRHLIWDLGWGFDMKNVTFGSVTVLVGTVVLTALTWLTVMSG
jgi:succinate dehydrogenase / fumarate reductase, cytochrome b subunit